MATVQVLASGNQWRVVRNGATVSNHRKKSRARAAANRVARPGDTLKVQREDGTFMETKTFR